LHAAIAISGSGDWRRRRRVWCTLMVMDSGRQMTGGLASALSSAMVEKWGWGSRASWDDREGGRGYVRRRIWLLKSGITDAEEEALEEALELGGGGGGGGGGGVGGGGGEEAVEEGRGGGARSQVNCSLKIRVQRGKPN
jgi:hypothetical protein